MPMRAGTRIFPGICQGVSNGVRRGIRRGYTLIEVLIVVTILGLAGALLVPYLSSKGDFDTQAAVHMQVDKAGQQGAPFQVDHAGGVRLQRHDFCKRTHSKDTAIFDGNGIGARSGIGHRQDRTAGINRIRRFGTLRHCGSGHQNGGTRHQECSAGQAHCKGLPKDTAGLGPAGEAIVTVGPRLYPVSGPGQSV